MNDFYIGYLPSAPPSIRKRVRLLVAALFVLSIAGAVLFAASQHQFATSSFDYGKPTEFSGTISLQPFPTLNADNSSNSDASGEPSYLLVAPGKFGADSMLAGQHSVHVRLRGTLIHRAEGHMLEVEPGSITNLPISPPHSFQWRDLGPATLNGEIVDTKCFLGVMNPGEGKVHRDCAARCLSGGIPPALISSDFDGTPRLYLLTGKDGLPLPKEDFLQKIGQPVSIQGQVLEANSLYYLHTDAADIVSLP